MAVPIPMSPDAEARQAMLDELHRKADESPEQRGEKKDRTPSRPRYADPTGS